MVEHLPSDRKVVGVLLGQFIPDSKISYSCSLFHMIFSISKKFQDWSHWCQYYVAEGCKG